MNKLSAICLLPDELSLRMRERLAQGNKGKVFCSFVEYRWDFHGDESGEQA
jgi:hypothetical protein